MPVPSTRVIAQKGVDMPRIIIRSSLFAAGTLLITAALIPKNLAAQEVIGHVPDVSEHFQDLASTYFVGAELASFDAASGEGLIRWDRYEKQPSLSFNKLDVGLSRAESTEFPGTEYDQDPALPFSIDFVSPRTVRLRMNTRHVPIEMMRNEESLMLDGPVSSARDAWRMDDDGASITYTSDHAQVRIQRNPWRIEFYDADGRLLTQTQSLGEPSSYAPYIPFSFVRRARDLGRSTAATFELRHDEKIYGGGETTTRLNKRGQKVVAYTRDGMGVMTHEQYKAVPFFMSSNGYGMFAHTSTPVTMDFGHDFDSHTTLYTGDELIDLFVFMGGPKDILAEYTAVSGRSPVPPLWSFGLWMSRITYDNEAQVRRVAQQLRDYQIPTDVLHLDTGWFEVDWRNDYLFAESRFDDPARMVADLRDQGFNISLWQLTYFTSKNRLWREIVENGYHVKNEGGVLPYEDAILDFSNPDAVAWYEGKLRGLLEMGVSVIKADFGEDAPLHGLYHSGRTGWYEHNLYPVRYNDVVFNLTREVAGGGVIWGRSAWAGSQRYPLHWGGDAENTDAAMAASLRAGLSMGLSGFTYWSHDIGGFVDPAPRELYRRWTPFGALTSHTRTHGAPPREPWEYDEELVVDFRNAMNLRYSLMPYIYGQSVDASNRGLPMMRALFIEYPNDPTSWLIEDQYLFGSDLLVAPLFSDDETRPVYLPPGEWIDYQSGDSYAGARWHEITAGEIPIILLVRSGAAIPHVAVAQHTGEIDWSNVELRVFGDEGSASALIALPEEDVHPLTLQRDGSTYRLGDNPLGGRVNFRITN